jgi:signal peptidase II
MRKHLKALVIILLIFSFIGCDQATKSYAMRKLPLSTSVSYLGGLVRFQFAENRGYFLSIGSTWSEKFHKVVARTMTVIALVGLIVLLLFANKIKLPHLFAYTLLLAGSFGNLIDRLFNHGLVVDFIVLGTNRIHTGILNVADLLITGSILMLIVAELVHKRTD